MNKIPDITVTHNGTDCDLYAGRYYTGGVALQLVERSTGEPWATATVNLPDEADRLGPGEVFIKDYSENAGMMDTLVLAGVVTRAGRYVRSGYVDIEIAQLTPAVTKATAEPAALQTES